MGTTTVDSHTCRWLESEFTVKKVGREQDGLKGARRRTGRGEWCSTIKILRGWQKKGSETTKLVDGDGEKAEGEMTLALFWGRPKDTKTVDVDNAIDWEKGQLNVTRMTHGKMEFPGGLEATQKVWLNKEVQFGFAAIEPALPTVAFRYFSRSRSCD